MVSVGQDGLSANQVSPHGVMLVQFHADLLPFWWGFRRGCSIRPTLSKGFLNECAIEIAIFSYLRGEKMNVCGKSGIWISQVETAFPLDTPKKY